MQTGRFSELTSPQTLFTVGLSGPSWRPLFRSAQVSVQRSPRLGAANPLIDGMLLEDLTACCRQRLTARRVLGRLVDEHGVAELTYSSCGSGWIGGYRPWPYVTGRGTCRSGFVHRCRVLVVARRDYYPGGSSPC